MQVEKIQIEQVEAGYEAYVTFDNGDMDAFGPLSADEMRETVYYINELNGKTPPNIGKVKFILENVEGSHTIPTPKEWREGLVCVVNNGPFEAAAYAYNEPEMNEFKEPGSGRPRQWMLVPGAKELAK